MAKTAEEKAEAKAEKEAAKEARQEAKEAAKAEKAADKAEARAEKDQIVNLKSAQDAEILAYRQALSGSELSDKEIKNLIRDEKRSNKDEVRTAKDTLSADGFQYIGLTGTRPDGTEYRGPIISQMSTIGQEYHAPIIEDLKGALSFYRDYNLPGLSSRGNATIGIGLDDILKVEYSKDPVTGEYTKTSNLAKTLDRAQDYVHNTFSADELREQGVRLKEDKNNPGLYTWKFGSEENKGYIFFKDNGDGTYTGIGANRLDIDIPDRNFLEQAFVDVPFLPEIAAIGASFIPGAQPFVGEIYAAGKGLQTSAMGGDLGDVLKSAGLAYFGSNILPGMVQGALPADLASIPGVTQGVSRATMGALSGQELDEALLSGLISGAGSFTGSEISKATGSPGLGRAGGALTSAALSGGDVGQAVQNAIVGNVIRSGLEYASPQLTGSITDPTLQRIAENSLTNIIGKGLSGESVRPSIPIPIPGVVRRQFENFTNPVRAARGGSINVPMRRNVKELIPLRRGPLSMMRR